MKRDTSATQQSDSVVAAGFIRGTKMGEKDMVPPSKVPGIECCSLKGMRNPRAWGKGFKCP